MRLARRTLLGPWVALPALLLEVVNLVQRGAPWRGEGLWTVAWAAIALTLLGPLLSGAIALDAARLARPGSRHLLVAAGPLRALGRLVAWGTLPAAAVHLGATGTALALGGVTDPAVGWPALALQLVLHVAVLGWFGVLGAAVGRCLPPVVAGVAGGGAGFVASYAWGVAGVDGLRLLDVGAATVSRLGLRPSTALALLQFGLLVGSGLVLLALRTRGRGEVSLPSRASWAALLAVAVVVPVTTAHADGPRLLADPQAPTHCRTATVTLCVHAEHAHLLPQAQRSLELLAGRARAAGYADLVPQRVVEQSRTWYGAAPDVAVTLPGAPEGWAYELSAAAHCPQLRSDVPPPEPWLRRSAELEVTWAHLGGVRSDLLDLDPTLRVLAPAEALDTARALAACRA